MAPLTRPSVCPLDCPDTCSLDVEVAGRHVLRLEGSRRNPLTAGFMCAKVRRFPELTHGPGRLRRPALRVGLKGEGRFREVSWDEALGRVAEELGRVRREHGGEAILPLTYGGSNGSLTHGTLDERLFRRLGASQLARTVCAAPTGAAAGGLYGRMVGVALPDYVHARLIVLWGVNPQASGVHLLPPLKAARAEGARLIVVDPRRTKLARQADLHLPLQVGSDLPLALALIRELFARGAADQAFLDERCHADQVQTLRARAEPWTLARAAEVCGLAEDDLRRFAELYAESRPAVIRCGWGLERNRQGGAAVAAVLALPAVAGHFGVRGGGYTMSNSRAFALNQGAAIRAQPRATRTINMNRTGRALLEPPESGPPIQALFCYDANPLATLPDQERLRSGLLRDDLFTVVFEQVRTDTSRYADVLLPATTFLEHDELRVSYGALLLQRSRPVIPPVGEARSNLAVFAELIERLGLAEEGDPTSPEALIEALLGPARAAELERAGQLEPPCGARPIQMVDALPATPDGKVHLVPAALERALAERGGLYVHQPPPPSRFPLTLISPASPRAISSTLFQLHEQVVPLALAPADAAARGIESGDRVRAYNDLGEVVTLAVLDPDLREGVACLPKGLWAQHTLNGATANALCPDHLSDLGGGACFNDARIEVDKL